MKTIIDIFKSIQIYLYNRRQGMHLISESEFNRLVDRNKPIIVINN